MASGPTPNNAPFRNADDWGGIPVAVSTPGTAVQLPDIEIPDGVSVYIMAPTDNSGLIYFQRTAREVLDTNARIPLTKGTGVTFFVTNANLFWIDAATANDRVFVVVEKYGTPGSGQSTGQEMERGKLHQGQRLAHLATLNRQRVSSQAPVESIVPADDLGEDGGE